MICFIKLLLLSVIVQWSQQHGYIEFPPARQYFCRQTNDHNNPNTKSWVGRNCQEAYDYVQGLRSTTSRYYSGYSNLVGFYQFQQLNEYAQLIGNNYNGAYVWKQMYDISGDLVNIGGIKRQAETLNGQIRYYYKSYDNLYKLSYSETYGEYAMFQNSQNQPEYIKIRDFVLKTAEEFAKDQFKDTKLAICSSGKLEKSGMDLTGEWTRTQIVANDGNKRIMNLKFKGTALHAKHFWRFYISKANYNVYSPLTWNDIELFYSIGEIQPVNSYYNFEIPLPKERTGKATIFTWWQRIDPAGEGFYNCADINIVPEVIKCFEGCLSCSDAGQANCSQCQEGYELTRFNECKKKVLTTTQTAYYTICGQLPHCRFNLYEVFTNVECFCEVCMTGYKHNYKKLCIPEDSVDITDQSHLAEHEINQYINYNAITGGELEIEVQSNSQLPVEPIQQQTTQEPTISNISFSQIFNTYLKRCNVLNCQICPFANPDSCVSCKESFQLIFGKCQCPNNAYIESDKCVCRSPFQWTTDKQCICTGDYHLIDQLCVLKCNDQRCKRCAFANYCLELYEQFQSQNYISLGIIKTSLANCNIHYENGCQECQKTDINGKTLERFFDAELKLNICRVLPENPPCQAQNCLECEANNQLLCKTCSSGYINLYSECHLKTVDCTVPNCMQCMSKKPTTCWICDDGFKLNKYGQCDVDSNPMICPPCNDMTNVCSDKINFITNEVDEVSNVTETSEQTSVISNQNPIKFILYGDYLNTLNQNSVQLTSHTSNVGTSTTSPSTTNTSTTTTTTTNTNTSTNIIDVTDIQPIIDVSIYNDVSKCEELGKFAEYSQQDDFSNIPYWNGLVVKYDFESWETKIFIENQSSVEITFNKISYTSIQGIELQMQLISKDQNKRRYQYQFTKQVWSPQPDQVPTSVILSAGQNVEIKYEMINANRKYINKLIPIQNVVIDGKKVKIDNQCVGVQCYDPVKGKKIYAYYTSWDRYARQYKPERLQGGQYNNLVYAFINYDSSGGVFSHDDNADRYSLPYIAQLRQRYPYMNALLSFGGWTLSWNFNILAKCSNRRANFINNAIEMMRISGFNGIDIDWEFPVLGAQGVQARQQDLKDKLFQEDAVNFVKILQELRQQLDLVSQKDNTKYYLSIAISAGNDKNKLVEQFNPGAWSKINQIVDDINIMTYDYNGAWSAISGPMSPLYGNYEKWQAANDKFGNFLIKDYNINDSLAFFEGLGLNLSNFTLGMPLYSRTSQLTQGLGDSFGQYRPTTGDTRVIGQFDNTGVYEYKYIKQCELNPLNCNKTLKDLKCINGLQAKSFGEFTPWCYNAQYYISFDDRYSTIEKINYLKSKQMAGVMFWQISGDLEFSHQDSIMRVALQELTK